MDIASAFKNLQIPAGSTNRIVPEWLFPRRFPTKQRLTTSGPDAILVTDMPNKKVPDIHPRYALRSRAGCRGDRGLSATAPAYQPSSRVRNSIQLQPNQRHINLEEVKYCEDTRPRIQLEAAHHQHSVLRQHIRQAAANVCLHTILLGVRVTIYSPWSL